jgi:iron complex outermembrane recepter protein
MDTVRRPQFARTALLLIAFACFIAIPGISQSQDIGNNTKDSSSATEQKKLAADPMTITVIVTARKELEPAQSIPLSITAVTDSQFQDADIQEVHQAAAYSPNTFINEFTARALSNPFFRGIGGGPTNPGVSTFIDGVPQFNSFSSNIEMVDVGQIEFVRGPEGSLYGRNTAGGLINITSRPPTETWTEQAQAALGNYSYHNLRASISGPILKDRFNLNLAGGYSGRDGYTKNDLTQRDLDKRAAGFGKAQLLFQASDRLKIKLILSGEQDQDGDYALGDLNYVRTNPNHVSRDFEGYTHRSVGSTTLIADYHGSALDFSSTSGGIWWKNHSLTDLDYQTASLSNGGLYAIRDTVDQQHQFTQEFRFASARDKAIHLNHDLNLKWQTGIFVFNQNYQQDATNDISSAFSFFPRSVSQSSADLNDWGVSLYGQTEFAVWKKLHITTGVRFDYENKGASLGTGSRQSTDLSDTFSEASPQFSAAYRYSPSQMSYVSVSRGYKAGGFNPAPTGISAPAGTEVYGTEHTWNYELGHKSDWLGDRLESTLAFFYIDWKNLQLNQQVPLSGGQYYIGNAGAAYSKGLEFEMKYRPFRWWELFGMAGYTHARFLSGSRAFNANAWMDQPIGGNTLPFTPTYTGNAGTQVSWTPCPHAKLYLRIQVSLHGDFQYDASNAQGQTNYSLTGFRGGARGKHWFAEGWVDNAWNAHYVPIAIPYAQLGAPSGYIGESGAPRTYGGRAGLSF